MKIRARMFLLYLLGGALPLLLFGFYLISDTQNILLEQAMDADVSILNAANQQAGDLLTNVNMVSRYFIFDQDLERIALHEYESYQELIDDYREYSRFIDYGKLYARTISSYSIYLNNPTIRSNANFVLLNDDIRSEDWYRIADADDSVSHWLNVPQKPTNESGLALTRRIVTEDHRDVGILVLHLRKERVGEILNNMDRSVYLRMNEEEILASSSERAIEPEVLQAFMNETGGVGRVTRPVPGQRYTSQGSLEIEGEQYLVTNTRLQAEGIRDTLELMALRPYDEILSETNHQSNLTYLAFATSAIISLLLISMLSWSFSARIRRFQKEIERTADGELTFTQKLKGNDEISELYNHLGSIIHQINQMNMQIQEEQLRSEQFRSEQKDAELKMLTMQINPHFLYNTLETIRMRARIEGQTEIEDIVKRLAKLLRYSLEGGKKEVTIAQELEMITSYLQIQQYRLGDRLKVTIDLPEELGDCYILPLIIQPLVENAMVHALEMKEGSAHLEVAIYTTGHDLAVEVRDNGSGMDSETLSRVTNSLDRPSESAEHLGLRNVHQRLRLHYGQPYGVEIKSTWHAGTIVRLLMPRTDKQSTPGV